MTFAEHMALLERNNPGAFKADKITINVSSLREQLEHAYFAGLAHNQDEFVKGEIEKQKQQDAHRSLFDRLLGRK